MALNCCGLPIIILGKIEQAAAKISFEDLAGKAADSGCLFAKGLPQSLNV